MVESERNERELPLGARGGEPFTHFDRRSASRGCAGEERRSGTDRPGSESRADKSGPTGGARRSDTVPSDADSHVALLREASRLLAASHDWHASLQLVADLVVPAIADWCLVDVMTADGTGDLVAIAHPDPRVLKWGRAFRRRRPVRPGDAPGVGRVLRRGVAEHITELRPTSPDDGHGSASEVELFLRIGAHSFACVPLVARGNVLGAISFLRTTVDAGSFSVAELELAEALASIAAIAVDNARLREHANRAHDAKTSFLSTISHELRTPLAVVLGYADLLQSGLFGTVSSSQRDPLIRITESSTHLLSIIEEILQVAEIESVEKISRREPVDLVSLINGVVELHDREARRKGLHWTIEIDDSAKTIRSDGAKIRRILLHLVSNAVKFTHAGEVRITATRELNGIALVVQDTGVGIAPVHRERIFSAFWQVEQGPTRPAGGAGIGLNIAQRLAATLGGRVSVESELGRGSVFTLHLPD